MSSMLIDHIAVAFVSPYHLVMRKIIGRLAFIIYAFLIAESYYHLKDKPGRLQSHMLKLLILGLVAELPYDLFEHGKWLDFSTQNVIWTLLLGFFVLISTGWIMRRITNKTASIVVSAAICIVVGLCAHQFKSEYDFAGVILIALIYTYLCRTDGMGWIQKVGCLVLIEGLFCFLYVWQCSNFGGWNEIIKWAQDLKGWGIGVAVTIVPLAWYNRKLGYHSKWFGWLYSIFYPLQFVILLITRYFIRSF